MERGPKFVNTLIATSLFLASCGRNTNENVLPILFTPTPDQTPLFTPTVIAPTPTPTPNPNITQTPSGWITNGMTGAVYEVVPNPDGDYGRCVRLSYYTDSNKQDVVGAATALGPDRYRYNDYYNFKVFMPDHRVIGSFTTDEIPMSDSFAIVPPGTVVCED